MVKKLPTIKEIARRLNVSVSTVSRALHDHPSIGLRTRMQVQQVAMEINYEPNQAGDGTGLTVSLFRYQRMQAAMIILLSWRSSIYQLYSLIVLPIYKMHIQ